MSENESSGSGSAGADRGGAKRAAEGIPLAGGGVLKQGGGTEPDAIPVDFGDLVRPFLLLGLTALGVVPHPDSGKTSVDLRAARAAIETLELLRAKTDGRREEDETRLIEQALFDLKMQFVEVERRRGKA